MGFWKRNVKALNYPFIKYITEGIPWMIMKAGVSLDGRLNYQAGQSGWITGEQSARAVHKLRNTVDAILVGRKTVEIDNPSLTTRLARGSAKDPIRIILDTDLVNLRLPPRCITLTRRHLPGLSVQQMRQEQKKMEFEKIGIRLLLIARDGKGCGSAFPVQSAWTGKCLLRSC